MSKPYIIAEIASAHEGRPELALQIAKYVVSAGADAVKFQIFKRDQLLIKSNPYYDNFGEVELSSKQWQKLLKVVFAKKINIIVEPYDIESFNTAEETGIVNSYKIPTASIGETALLEKVKNTGKPVYIGVGGAEWSEIEHAVSLFKRSEITLVCGFQNFPTNLEDSKLYQIPQLKEAFGCDVGYADHVDAEEAEMARFVPTLAVSMGAKVIEKHITDDRSRKGRDHYSALNPDEFKSFVRLIRCLPDIIGEVKEWNLSEAEKKYRIFAKRQAVVSREIAVGTKLNFKDIVFKRTNEKGLSHKDLEKYIGRRFARPKNTDDPLTPEDFVWS